ncbi:MAG: DUF2007 domain-containing protein [Bacteroidetes bacterium]|nr:DUF2007 domain-containing protein [Bacteroidota bacterium]
MSEIVKLATNSAIFINRVAQLLQEEQIEYHIKDNVESARLAGFGASYYDVDLYVAEEDASKALAILESAQKEDEN